MMEGGGLLIKGILINFKSWAWVYLVTLWLSQAVLEDLTVQKAKKSRRIGVLDIIKHKTMFSCFNVVLIW